MLSTHSSPKSNNCNNVGHIARKNEENLERVIMFKKVEEGKWHCGRQNIQVIGRSA